MKRILQRKEAAEILGVHPQTISNYIKKGLLKEASNSTPTMRYVTESSVQKLMSDIDDIKNSENVIETYKLELQKDIKELRKEKNKYTAYLKTAKRERRSALYLSHIMNRDALGMYEFFFGNLPERDGDIVRQLAEGYSVQEVADNLGLSRSRIGQIFTKSIRRMRERIQTEENYLSLELKCRQQERKIAWLNKQLAKASEPVPEALKAWLKKQFAKASEPMPEECNKLFTPLVDFDLSVRCLNCCHQAGIETPHDLMNWKRADLLQIKNFGKKSLSELETLMKNLGIAFKQEQGWV